MQNLRKEHEERLTQHEESFELCMKKVQEELGKAGECEEELHERIRYLGLVFFQIGGFAFS